MSWRDDPITEKQEAMIAQIEEDAFMNDAWIPPFMPEFSITQPSGTYLYGGWAPVPQVCCTSGHEKTNCKNCGASLCGHYRCEYCGTVNN